MAGEVFNYTSCKAKAGGEAWRYSNEWTNWSGNLYVSAPSFVLRFTADSVALRKCNINVDAYYYNGSSWVYRWSDSCSVSGANDQTKSFYHNRGNEATSSLDMPHHHMWWFVIGSGWTGSAKTILNVWCGGIGLYNETEYNNLCKNRHVKYSAGDWWTSYGSADEFAQNQAPSLFRGNQINDTTGKYLCATDI